MNLLKFRPLKKHIQNTYFQTNNKLQEKVPMQNNPITNMILTIYDTEVQYAVP